MWCDGGPHSVLCIFSDGREGDGLPDVSWLPVYAHVFYEYLVLTEARGVFLESVCSALCATGGSSTSLSSSISLG